MTAETENFFFIITELANSTWSPIPSVETLVCDALVLAEGLRDYR